MLHFQMMVVWLGFPVPACQLVAGGLAGQAGRVLLPASSWLAMLLAAPLGGACLVGELPGGVRWRGVTAGLAGMSVA